MSNFTPVDMSMMCPQPQAQLARGFQAQMPSTARPTPQKQAFALNPCALQALNNALGATASAPQAAQVKAPAATTPTPPTRYLTAAETAQIYRRMAAQQQQQQQAPAPALPLTQSFQLDRELTREFTREFSRNMSEFSDGLTISDFSSNSPCRSRTTSFFLEKIESPPRLRRQYSAFPTQPSTTFSIGSPRFAQDIPIVFVTQNNLNFEAKSPSTSSLQSPVFGSPVVSTPVVNPTGVISPIPTITVASPEEVKREPTPPIQKPEVESAAPATPPASESQTAATAARTNVLDMRRYKTQLCRNFMRNGTCAFGDSCAYAHGVEEIRSGKESAKSVTPPPQSPPAAPVLSPSPTASDKSVDSPNMTPKADTLMPKSVTHESSFKPANATKPLLSIRVDHPNPAPIDIWGSSTDDSPFKVYQSMMAAQGPQPRRQSSPAAVSRIHPDPLLEPALPCSMSDYPALSDELVESPTIAPLPTSLSPKVASPIAPPTSKSNSRLSSPQTTSPIKRTKNEDNDMVSGLVAKKEDEFAQAVATAAGLLRSDLPLNMRLETAKNLSDRLQALQREAQSLDCVLRGYIGRMESEELCNATTTVEPEFSFYTTKSP